MIEGIYLKDGERTEICRQGGMMELLPPSTQLDPEPVKPAAAVLLNAPDWDDDPDDGPLTDIWGNIVIQLHKEMRREEIRRRIRRNRIKKAMVPTLALISIILLSIMPDSMDHMPAGVRSTMLIIVSLAAAAYLVLVIFANHRRGVIYD